MENQWTGYFHCKVAIPRPTQPNVVQSCDRLAYFRPGDQCLGLHPAQAFPCAIFSSGMRPLGQHPLCMRCDGASNISCIGKWVGYGYGNRGQAVSILPAHLKPAIDSAKRFEQDLLDQTNVIKYSYNKPSLYLLFNRHKSWSSRHR